MRAETGACIAAVPATDTIKRVGAGRVLLTLPREEIWLVQTPQVFRKDLLLEAYREAQRQGWNGTDDASFVERLGVPVSVVRGERSNIKVTTPEDLDWGGMVYEPKVERGAEGMSLAAGGSTAEGSSAGATSSRESFRPSREDPREGNRTVRPFPGFQMLSRHGFPRGSLELVVPPGGGGTNI